MSLTLEIAQVPVSIETASPSCYRIERPADYVHLAAEDLRRNPSVRADAGRLGDLWLQAASCVGRSHMTSTGCSSAQDAYSYKSAGGVTVVAVADGLGSHRQSHIGSTMVCNAACESFHAQVSAVQTVTAEVLDAALADANDRVCSALGDRELRAFSTTLLVAVIDSRCTPAVLSTINVGDGGIGLLFGDGIELLAGETGEGPINIVHATLPTRDHLEGASEIRTIPGDCVGVVLMTDGVSNDLPEAAIRDWLSERWCQHLDAYAMADTLRYVVRGSMDDRTAAVLLFGAGENQVAAAVAVGDAATDDDDGPSPSCWRRFVSAMWRFWLGPVLVYDEHQRAQHKEANHDG